MGTMSLNPEQFYKPERRAEEKPQLKLNLNLGEDKWNTVLSSPDLKKIGINTPELDRMVANNSVFNSTYNGGNTLPSALPPPYSTHSEEISVQGPSMSQAGPEEDEQLATRSFIAALREIHEQNDFKSEIFNIPANTSATTSGQVAQAAYSEQYSKPQIPDCTQSWAGNFQVPVSNYNQSIYNPLPAQPAYQAPYLAQEQLPHYDIQESKQESFVPDPNQIDKLNLSTAEKLNIYSQIPIHEVADPDLQERLKTERKKMRNRIAASKCRKRKLQKEAELEDKVQHLKKKNTDLSGQLLGLRDEVKELKVKIMSHVNAGCNIKQFSLSSGDDSHMSEDMSGDDLTLNTATLMASNPAVSLSGNLHLV